MPPGVTGLPSAAYVNLVLGRNNQFKNAMVKEIVACYFVPLILEWVKSGTQLSHAILTPQMGFEHDDNLQQRS